MTIGVVGKKRGMTRIFMSDGVSEPVTVIEVTPNTVLQLKLRSVDGYDAVKVVGGDRGVAPKNKCLEGEYSAFGAVAGEVMHEFRLDGSAMSEYAVGQEITVSLFDGHPLVDVQSTAKGKGFQGAVKRWNFRTQDATHGNSLSHRAPGSIGQRQTPGRVFKGKKMAGRMGGQTVTVKSLSVVKVDSERSLLLVRGAVPGASGAMVVVTPSARMSVSGGSK